MVLGQTAWLPGTATNCNLCNCFRPQPHRLSEGEDVCPGGGGGRRARSRARKSEGWLECPFTDCPLRDACGKGKDDLRIL